MPATVDPLPSWNETGARQAIVEFVEAVTGAGRESYLPPEERVAVFDNDGTLWCEKPMPIELGSSSSGWLGDVITRHYAGDDSDLKVLLGGILQAFAGMDVEDYQDSAHAFLHQGRHPTLDRAFHQCGYRPMIELLGYLEANGFTSYIASGGDRDFMRPVTQAVYGIPSERVIGNSNGDIPMLEFAGGRSRPGLRLLVLHDDAEREFDYVAGAERSLEEAERRGWTVVSIKRRLGDRLRPDRELTGSESSSLGA
jgi:hypothetical protein